MNATEPAEKEAVVTGTPGDLHITLRSMHPIALCGHRCETEWDKPPATAGRDRCARCFAIARDKFGGVRL